MKKTNKAIRVAAMICVVLLIGLYIATFVAAIMAKPYAMGMFVGCLASTVFVPIALHILIRMFAIMSEKKEGSITMRDVHKMKKEQKVAEKQEAAKED